MRCSVRLRVCVYAIIPVSMMRVSLAILALGRGHARTDTNPRQNRERDLLYSPARNGTPLHTYIHTYYIISYHIITLDFSGRGVSLFLLAVVRSGEIEPRSRAGRAKFAERISRCACKSEHQRVADMESLRCLRGSVCTSVHLSIYQSMSLSMYTYTYTYIHPHPRSRPEQHLRFSSPRSDPPIMFIISLTFTSSPSHRTRAERIKIWRTLAPGAH